MSDEWMRTVEEEAGQDDMPAKPQWHIGVPFCREECPYFDGKRCERKALDAGWTPPANRASELGFSRKRGAQ